MFPFCTGLQFSLPHSLSLECTFGEMKGGQMARVLMPSIGRRGLVGQGYMFAVPRVALLSHSCSFFYSHLECFLM